MSSTGPRIESWAVSIGAGLGLAFVTVLTKGAASPAWLPATTLLAVLCGAGALATSRSLTGSDGPALLATGLSAAGVPSALRHVLLVPADTLDVVPFAVGVVVALALVRLPLPRLSLGRRTTFGTTLAFLVGSTGAAHGWSVDEPHTSTAEMRAHNGIIERVDTHAFLLHRGVVILRNDGHTAVAAFLDSADPTAPHRRDLGDGQPLPQRQSYLWRMQTGARDADRSLKKRFMPDHFFNWWTHSGKGLLAGPSAATWAEQQFAIAVRSWRAGDRATAMYHLGAAAHLVDDGCAPPHAFVLDPNHRAYENWMMDHQPQMTVSSGGIYRNQFRVHTGHGGTEWSSSHTRGWVDECAHRAADMIPNAAVPPPDSTDDASGEIQRTDSLFRQTQRLTAGYLAFFFETVGGP